MVLVAKVVGFKNIWARQLRAILRASYAPSPNPLFPNFKCHWAKTLSLIAFPAIHLKTFYFICGTIKLHCKSWACWYLLSGTESIHHLQLSPPPHSPSTPAPPLLSQILRKLSFLSPFKAS